jgi:hypothetical protein
MHQEILLGFERMTPLSKRGLRLYGADNACADDCLSEVSSSNHVTVPFPCSP